jgi:hypothetical protein
MFRTQKYDSHAPRQLCDELRILNYNVITWIVYLEVSCVYISFRWLEYKKEHPVLATPILMRVRHTATRSPVEQ